MAIKQLQIIDMTQLQIINHVLELFAGTKTSPTEGNIYYDTTTGVKAPRWYDGTTHRIAAYPTSAITTTLTIGGAAVTGTLNDAARSDHVHAMPALATSSVSGFMAFADKAKLDNAAYANTINTLCLRDANGRIEVSDPAATTDVANFQWVRAQTVNNLAAPSADWSMNTHKITNLVDPTNAQDAATKNYVDTAVQGLDIKASVRGATTGSLAIASRTAQILTITGAGLTLDTSVVIANGDRILVKDSTTGTGAGAWDNGIYVASGIGGSSVTLTRATDSDSWLELPGAFVFIEEGTTLGDTGWVCTVSQGGTIGTTAVTFAQFSGAGSFTAGDASGITGTGVYDATVGNKFTFRGIKAATNKVAIALSTKDITVDINEVNLNMNNTGTVLGVAKGGTNIASWTTNAIPYASGATTIAQLSPNSTATNKFLTDVSSGAPAWNTIAVGDLPVVDVAHGGTNKTSYAIGDILQASASTTLTSLASVATGNVLISGGVTTVSSWGKVGLTTHVNGTLPIGNGGTNKTTWTLNSIAYASSANVLGELLTSASATRQFIGASTGSPIPTYVSLANSDLPTVDVAHGGTNKASWTVGSMPWASASTTIAEITPNATATVKVLTQTSSAAPVWQDLPTISGARKLVAGTTAGTTTTINHGWGTKDLVVMVRDAANTYQVVGAEITMPDTANVAVTFANSVGLNAYYITVIG